jgi:hypothetical protein
MRFVPVDLPLDTMVEFFEHGTPAREKVMLAHTRTPLEQELGNIVVHRVVGGVPHLQHPIAPVAQQERAQKAVRHRQVAIRHIGTMDAVAPIARAPGDTFSIRIADDGVLQMQIRRFYAGLP